MLFLLAQSNLYDDFQVVVSPKEIYFFNAKRASQKEGELSIFRSYFPLITRVIARDFSPLYPGYRILRISRRCHLLQQPGEYSRKILLLEKGDLATPVKSSRRWLYVSVYKDGKNFWGWIPKAFVETLPSILILYSEEGKELPLTRADFVIITSKIADEFLKNTFRGILTLRAALSEFQDVNPRNPRAFGFARKTLLDLKILPPTFSPQKFNPDEPVKKWEVIYTAVRLMDLTWYGDNGLQKIDLTSFASKMDDVLTSVKDVSYRKSIHPGFLFLFEFLAYEPDPRMPLNLARPIMTAPFLEAPSSNQYIPCGKLRPDDVASLPWTLALLGKIFTGVPVQYLKDSPEKYINNMNHIDSPYRAVKEVYPGMFEEVPIPSVFADSPDVRGKLLEAGNGWLKVETENGTVEEFEVAKEAGVFFPGHIAIKEEKITFKVFVENSTEDSSSVMPIEDFPVQTDKPITLTIGNLTPGKEYLISARVVYEDVGCFKIENACRFFSSEKKNRFLKDTVKIWFKKDRLFGEKRKKVFLVELSKYSTWWGMNPPVSKHLEKVKVLGKAVAAR